MSNENTPLLGDSPAGGAHPDAPKKGLVARIEAQCKYPLPIMIPSLLALWSCLFLAALDGTVASTLLAPISSDFDAADRAAGLGVSFLLSVSACTPLYGRLSDILGRRSAFLTALLFFTLGTAGCAAASSMTLLIVARAVAGAGAGGILTCSSTIMTDLVSLRARGLIQGLSNIIFGIGGASGGVFAGLVSDRYGWRMAFALQLPLLVLSMLLIVRFIQVPLSEEIRAVPLRQRIKRIDLPGPVLLVASVWSLLRLLNALAPSASTSAPSASTMYSENENVLTPWALYLYLATFLLSVAAFLSVETWVVAHPILPLNLLRRTTPACVSLVYFLSSCAFYALFFYYPTYFVAVRALSPSQAGLRLLPLTLTTAVGSIGAGIIMGHTGKYRTLQTISTLLPVFSCAWISAWTPIQPSPGGWAEYLGIAPAGLGLSGTYTTLVVAILASCGQGEVGVVNGLIYTSRTLGQVVGVGAAGTLLQCVLNKSLVRRLIEPGDVQDAPRVVKKVLRSITSIDELPPELAGRVRLAYSDGLRAVFVQVTILSTLAFLAALGVAEHSMDPGPDSTEGAQNERNTQIQHDAEEQIEGELL